MEYHEKEHNNDEWKTELRDEIVTVLSGGLLEESKSLEKIGEYYQFYVPTSLYKYYSDSEQSLNNIKNNQIWYSAPINFNDVFDCDISVNEQKILDDVFKPFSKERRKSLGSEICKNLQNDLNESKYTMGVSCFSESEDSLLMWAHYANNHQGICVEYNLMEINRSLGFSPIPVVYSSEKTILQNLGDNPTKILLHSLTSKSPEWIYEKEWRVVRDKGACGVKWDDEAKGALLEMIRPTSIIIGCAAKFEFEKEVRKFCLNSQISLYKMEKDSLQYKLNKKKILEFNQVE